MMFKVLAAFLAVVCYAQLSYAQNYVAEGYFVVDERALDTYISEISGTASYATKRAKAEQAMRKDIAYILTEANRLVNSLGLEGVNVEVRQRGLKFLDSDIFSASDVYSGDVISTSTGLRVFGDWLVSQNAYDTLKYDFAMLYTGYDLSGSSGIYTAGVANTGQICDETKALSLVEFNATYHTALNTAHEIGHLLGSSHDGAASSNIMASVGDPKNSRRWSFSSCSASDIEEFVETLSPNCLLSTSSASIKPSSTWATYEGKLFNPDAICQRTLNDSRSYMCMSPGLYGDSAPKGDSVCDIIYCHIPDTTYCKVGFASEGMICDKNKRCNNGKCQPDTSSAAGSVDATCVFGNQKSLHFPSLEFYGTCEEYIAKYGKQACYNDLVSTLCCATCKTQNSGIAGCEYGDKSSQCVKYSQASVCPNYGSDLCCGHCQGFKAKRSARQEEEAGYEVVVVEDDLENSIVLDERVIKVGFRSFGGEEED